MPSTLDRTPASRPRGPDGNRTRELGPSDSSDTGSDITGGPGLVDLEPLDLDRGTTDDPDRGGRTAGPDIGDSDLDSDSDAAGTGENIAAGRDPVRIDGDIRPDRIIEDLSELERDDGDESGSAAGNRSGASVATADEKVPSIDDPPPLPKGSDLPVTDIAEGVAPRRPHRRSRADEAP
jgi:hypothetical protein